VQYTAQNLGSSLGTAFIGSILIGALGLAVQRDIVDNPQISSAVSEQIGVAISRGIDFVPVDQARTALEQAGVPAGQADALLASYADAQLMGLKVALLTAAAIALFSLLLTRRLPTAPLAPVAPIPAGSATDAQPIPGPVDRSAAGGRGEPLRRPQRLVQGRTGPTRDGDRGLAPPRADG
jgi:hypothetical protein